MIDRSLLNARIYTLNPAQPQAAALALCRDRIVAWATTILIRGLVGPAPTPTISAGAR